MAVQSATSSPGRSFPKVDATQSSAFRPQRRLLSVVSFVAIITIRAADCNIITASRSSSSSRSNSSSSNNRATHSSRAIRRPFSDSIFYLLANSVGRQRPSRPTICHLSFLPGSSGLDKLPASSITITKLPFQPAFCLSSFDREAQVSRSSFDLL